MATPKTIKLFLVDGEPTGVKKVQVSNWSGLAYVVPRRRLDFVAKREELQAQCLYFLIGQDEILPKVYIGEAENFGRRIADHKLNKEFWNQCVIFVSKDENLTKAHVRYLESKIITRVRSLNRSIVENTNSSEGAKLPEEDAYDMEEFIDYMKLCLASLGFTFLEDVENNNSSTEKTFYIKTRGGIVAKAKYGNEGVTVLEGSQIVKVDAVSFIDKRGLAWRLRREYIHSGILKDKGEHYEVQKSITFQSPSTASSFVLGMESNGWIYFKDENGKDLNSYAKEGKLG